MGRVYMALARAGRWNGNSAGSRSESMRRPGPARYPVPPNLKRPAGAGNMPRPVADSFEHSTPVIHEHPAPIVDLARGPVALDRQPDKSWGELIQFKTFRMRPSNVDDRLPAVKLGEEPAREVYRALAVRVSSIAARRDLKTIVVTSAREGEGKTSVAANLAASLAHVGRGRVLLVEADLRRPKLGERLGLLSRYGWGDLIAGRSSLINSIARIEPGGLHILVNRSECQPDGSGTLESLVDLMASQRPEELLAELKDQFDLIVIDCPCITEYAEGQRLVLIADGAILVARAGYTHHRTVTEALKLVPKEKQMGIVLNESQA